MASLTFFVEDFMKKIDQSQEYASIKPLMEFCDVCSPTPNVLNYSNKDEAIRCIPNEIVRNFSKSYGSHAEYPIDGLIHLENILSKKEDEDAIAQRILCLHFTKMQFKVGTSAIYFSTIDKMKVKLDANGCEGWKELAEKVMDHFQIKASINESVREYGFLPSNDEAVRVTFVEKLHNHFRGFSGFNEIFINFSHFVRRYTTFEGTDELARLALDMDIISITLHEYSQVKIRQASGDFNMSTPNLPACKDSTNVEDKEFGVTNECKIFGQQVHWFETARCNKLNIEFCKQFITAIRNGTELPQGLQLSAFGRTASKTMGIDMDESETMC